MELLFKKIKDTIEYMEKHDLWQVVYMDGLCFNEVEVSLSFAQDSFEKSYSISIDEELQIRCCDKKLFLEKVKEKYVFRD
ncbi:MAG: hypothetical protein ACRDCE_04650 [Cetobacterium sp.]|uniref:hypothetical protein n=1 Tax=Cetobacterium sp. TaxID=2071632 RepID=UPI003EE6C79C